MTPIVHMTEYKNIIYHTYHNDSTSQLYNLYVYHIIKLLKTVNDDANWVKIFHHNRNLKVV